MPRKTEQSETLKIPKLRFPDFSGGWEDKKLDDISIRIGDGIHTTPTYDSKGDYYFINGNNLINGAVEINSSTKKVAHSEYLKHKRDLNLNTILISINGTIGNVSLYKNEKIVLGKSACYLKLSDSVDKYFLFKLLQDNKIQSHFISELTGSTIKNLSLKSIKNTNISVPNKNEQKKIAEFLNTVDMWIENLKEQKESFESYKKALMQIIFSQEIRFKDDKGKEFPKWEEKKLGDICDNKASTVSANSLDKNTGEYKIYGATGFLKYVDFYKEENAYISIVKDGAGVGRILLCEPKSSVLGTLNIIKPKIGVNLYFLYLLLGNINFVKYVAGATIPHIYFKDYKKERFLIPTISEQQKIAEFLTSVDNIIESKQQQITQAEQWKKGLMQGLFV